VATGVLFGVLPALQATRVDLNDALKQGDRGSAGRRGGFYRDALVVAEVAMALVLLVGAGLMLKTLARMQGLDVGFKPEGLLTMRTNLPYPKYEDGQMRVRFYDTVLDQVRTMPGVRSAAFASDLPFTAEGNTNGFLIEGRPAPPPGSTNDALYRLATNDYLKTLGARVLRGRLPGPEDTQSSTPVVLINETLARSFFPNEDPIGKRMRIDSPRWITIVAVIADVRERGVTPSPKPAVYLPLAQNLEGGAIADQLVVRVDGDPLALAGPARAAIAKADAGLPVLDVRLMEDILETGVASRRQQMRLLISFAVLALILAALGIYGLLSYMVAQRSREIGVRIALGAGAADIVRSVAAKGMALTFAGLAIGTGVALAVTRAMQSMLFGVAPADASTYAAVLTLLMLIGMVACAIPAVRAARVDPIVALRDE
jgi:putative ABC transport system permease protein